MNGERTVCVTGAGAGIDSAWEQYKLEARKMLENVARKRPTRQVHAVFGGFLLLLRYSDVN